MTKQVAKKEKQEVADFSKFSDVMGVAENVDSSDVQISRLSITQAMSDLVTSEQAKPGEYWVADEHKKLGDNKSPLEVIFVTLKKNWMIVEGNWKNGGQQKYLRMEDLTAQNANAPWYNEEADETRKLNYNFYVLDVKNKSPMPYIFTLTKAQIKQAKKLATYFSRLASLKKPSFSEVFKLTAEKQTKDKNTWYAPSWEKVRDASAEELEESYEWAKTIGQTNVSVQAPQEKIAQETSLEDDEVPF